MKKCIAIPLENGILCAHFGHCEQFAIVEVDGEEIKNMYTEIPPEHVPGLYPRWISGFGVTDVIAGGIGQKAIELFKFQGINVFAGAPVKDPVSLVKDFLSGILTLQANYCNHDGHQHRHSGCNH